MELPGSSPTTTEVDNLLFDIRFTGTRHAQVVHSVIYVEADNKVIASCRLPAVSTSHLPLNKTALIRVRTPGTIDQSRLFLKITSTLFRPLHTVFQQCCVQCIIRRIYDLTLIRQRVLRNVSRILYYACQRRGSRYCKLLFFSASASVAEVPQRSSASWSSQHFPKSLCDPEINTHVDSADLILASLLFMRLCVVTLWFNQWSMNFNWLTDPHLPSMATQILLYFLEPSIMAL